MNYKASPKRYSSMKYRRCGKSGVDLPLISLGLWHNFGGRQLNSEAKKMLFYSFDSGITHFDLANNYGPPAGSAEANFGKILGKEFKRYRDELIISSKAGYDMWEGPYGEWGSKKYIIASCDPNTPLEETAYALELIYKSGKALYIGISSYSSKKTIEMFNILKKRNIKIFIHQPSYSLINRWFEKDLDKNLIRLGIGTIAFSPLAQGMLSDKYLKGIPKASRASDPKSALDKEFITKRNIKIISDLNQIAKKRGQTLSQMALAWVLNNKAVTTALIGASSVKQIKENIESLDNLNFSKSELREIDKKAKEGNINKWARSSSY